MKTLNTRWRLIALVPLVAVAILSIGNRIGAVPDQNKSDQNKEAREAANEGGIWIVGGITQGQVIRFNVARLASGHPGGANLQLTVFDSNGNVLASNTYVFPQNQNNTFIQSSFFALSADQLPASAFDNTGRAELAGVVKSVDPSDPSGIVAEGEIFKVGDSRTLIHIAGTEMLRIR